MSSLDRAPSAPSPSEARVMGAVGLTMAFVGFSMSGVWVRLLVAMDPLALTGWRVVVALTVLFPAALWSARNSEAQRYFLRDVKTHLVAVRMTAFFIIAVIGFQQAPVAIVLLLLGLSPAWVVVLERRAGSVIPAQVALGVGMALVGGTLGLLPTALQLFGGAPNAGGAAIGAIAGLLAGALSASYAFERKYLRGAQGEAPGAFLMACLTSVWGVLSFGLAMFTQAGQLAPAASGEWLSVLGFGLVSTALPLWGLAAATRSLPPVLVALATPLVPFGGAFAAWLLLGQVPPLAFAVGAPIVLAGIVTVLFAPRALGAE